MRFIAAACLLLALDLFAVYPAIAAAGAPPGFADRLEQEERQPDAYRHWLVFEDGSGLCMATLPAGWILEGNFVQNHDSLSFPGLLWIRLRHPEESVAVSLLKSVGSRRFGHTPFNSDPKNLYTPESYVPFHDVKFMSAWQFLGIYVAPLLKAMYPGCVVGELEGVVKRHGAEKCLPSAGLSATHHLEDGGRMAIRIWLDLWERDGCPQPPKARAGGSREQKERYWGIERLLVVSAPETAGFSIDEASALVGKVLSSPDAAAALALSPERVFADSVRPKEENADVVAERLGPARRSLPPVCVPWPAAGAAPFSYAPPLAEAAAAGSVAPSYSLVNALAEMLMSGDSLYPEYAIREWEKRNRR